MIRRQLERMGWQQGEPIGLRQRRDNAEPQGVLDEKHWTIGRAPRAGVGTDLPRLEATTFKEYYDRFFVLLRQAQAVPIAMLKSKAFSTDKANGKQGIAGKRILHAHCAWSMAYHSGVHKRSPPVLRPSWAHGGLK